jgi:pantothenate kinase-related protein Tda10
MLTRADTYRTHSALKKVATDHPNNPLLSGRGPPGTHDVELATSVLDAVTSINKTNGHVDLPTFDKSLCNGEGDRSQKTIPVDGPLDVFLFEGWSVGFAPITPAELEKRYAAKDGKYFPQHSLASLAELNGYLASFAAAIYPYFSVLVQIEPTSYEHVFTWRLQQEHAMKTANGGRGMTDDEVDRFVKRYMPAYELWAGGVLNADVPWAGKVLRLEFGKDREVLAVTTPAARNVKTPKPEEVKTSKVETAKAESASTPVPAAASVAAATAPASVAAVETKSAAPAPVPTPAAASAATLTAASAAPVATPAAPAVTPSTTPSTRYNPGWSRKYLSGKSPLNPTYDQVPAVLTLHQDSVILRTTPHLALFPIQGPGGRICVHPLAKKGRIPVGGVGYLSGGVGVADFAADPFGSNVVLAGDDGVLRVWNVGPEGIEGPGPEPDKVVRGQNVDKIVQIAFHPTAKNLLVAATNEAGKASLRFFDIEAGTEAKQVALDVKGIAGMAIAPAGDRIAISTKDGRVGVLDPRDPSTLVTGDGHSSPRSCQLVWVDDTHILSIGFARGSMRQINLYTVGTSITTEASQSISVSPAVLFPSYDADTNILYVWGKGDQSIQAFEIHPGKPEAIAKLPAFTGPGAQHAVAFFPKQHVDPRKVEVAKCLRLTARSIEEVSFTIPRSKTTFFQDDIYVPTIDTLMHTTTASAWLAGDKTTPRVLDLKPDGMELLSSAPVTTTVRTKFVPAAKVMSEEDRRKKEMDDLFQRAKAGFSSDEDDEPPRSGLPPPDDDW